VGTYLEILLRYKWFIVVTTLVTCAVVTALTLVMPSTYTARVTLRVVASAQGGSTESVDYRYAERLMNTYVEILKSRPLLEEAARRVGFNSTAGQVAGQITVEAVPDTELMRISVEDGSPTLATDMANALAGLIIEQSDELYSGGGKSAREILEEQLKIIEDGLAEDRANLYSLLDSSSSDPGEIDALNSRIMLEEETYAMLLLQYEQARVAEAMRAGGITVVEPAVRPEKPTRPNKKLNIALGALVGLGAGAGLAFLFENLRTTTPAMQRLLSISRRAVNRRSQS
jgi:capsular polysaccharide biosynthesis protein